MIKRLLFIVIISLPLFCFAANELAGTPGSSYTKTGNGVLTAGDTLRINIGAAYPSMSFSGVTGAIGDTIVIIANNFESGSRFYVNGTITFNNCNYIKVMMYSQNTSLTHIDMVPNNTAGNINQNIRFTQFYMVGTGQCFRTFNSRPWTPGNETTWTMKNVQIDSFWCEGTGPMTRGAFGHPANEQDMEYGTVVANGVFKNPTDDGEFIIGIVGGFSYHDNWIMYTFSSYTDIHDIGIFQLGGGSCAGRAQGCGGGKIYNNHVVGRGFGRGWFARCNVFTFQGHNDSLLIYNNYKTGTVQFGFVQIQSIDCDTAIGRRHAASTNIDNNFLGNADNVENGFESSFAYVGPYLNNKLRIRNNGAFNVDFAGAPMIHKVAGTWTPAAGDTTKNRYYSTAAALLLDTLGSFPKFQPQLTSLVIDAGATVSYIVDDIVGTSRPKGSNYDIGPWEFTTTPPGTSSKILTHFKFFKN